MLAERWWFLIFESKLAKPSSEFSEVAVCENRIVAIPNDQIAIRCRPNPDVVARIA
jgi:hypothetical protein